MFHKVCFAVDSGYSNQWFQTDYWYGDWPDGFSVIGTNVTVPLHSMIMKDAKPDLRCRLPQNAVFHVWNVDRSIMWSTWSKIIPLKMSQTVLYKAYDRRGRPLETEFIKNDDIEYLIYGDQNFSLIRYQDVVMEVDADFFKYVATQDMDLANSPKDEWFYVACENGASGFIKYSDLFNKAGRFIRGLDSWTLGFKALGEVHDLRPAP